MGVSPIAIVVIKGWSGWGFSVVLRETLSHGRVRIKLPFFWLNDSPTSRTTDLTGKQRASGRVIGFPVLNELHEYE